MQSFLQYHRFKKYLTRQYERDKEKPETMRRGNAEWDITSPPISPSATANPSPANSSETIDSWDLDKAEHPNSARGGNEAEDFRPPQKMLWMEKGIRNIVLLTEADPSTAATQNTMVTALGTALTGINVRDRTTREGGDKGKVFVVGYDGEHDNMNPTIGRLRID